MDLSHRILGASTVTYLSLRASAPVLRIGADAFTRGDLALVRCFNFIAAARLSDILKIELDVAHTRDLFKTIAPSQLAVPHLGAVSLAVLGAAFEIKGVGGIAPLEAWVRLHAPKDVKDPIRTFYTIKLHESADRKSDRAALQASRASRRNRAHKIRVDRHIARSAQVHNP